MYIATYEITKTLWFAVNCFHIERGNSRKLYLQDSKWQVLSWQHIHLHFVDIIKLLLLIFRIFVQPSVCEISRQLVTTDINLLNWSDPESHIPVTSQCVQWRLKLLASRLFTQPFVQIEENIKAPRHWPLWGHFTRQRWIPHGPLTRKMSPFDDVIMVILIEAVSLIHLYLNTFRM